jgi:queuine tRNA-ribosyltransferase
MAFDECPPGESEYIYAKNSLLLTQRWLDRCINYLNSTQTFIIVYEQKIFFRFVQGNQYHDPEKKHHVNMLLQKMQQAMPIGGLSVGETRGRLCMRSQRFVVRISLKITHVT